MPNKTNNYGLKKPLENEFYDINIENANMDIIDTELKKVNDGKVDKVAGKVLSTNDFNNTYKSKLDGIAEGATKYTHPASHPASIITEDNEHKFVTNEEKTQITTNKNDIADLKAKQEDNDLKSFETDVLMTPLTGCNGGFVSTDIYGKTAVNIIKNSKASITLTSDGSGKSYVTNGVYGVTNIKQNQYYTVIFYVSKLNGISKITLGGGYFPQTDLNVKLGINAFKLYYTNANTSPSITPLLFNTNSSTDCITLDYMMLLEDDWTNNPPNQFFEGMRHVGQYTYVSGKYVVKNLFDGEMELGELDSNGGLISNSVAVRSKNYISVNANSNIVISQNGIEKTVNICFYDNAFKFIFKTVNSKVTTPINCSYIKIWYSTGYTDTTKLQVEEGNTATLFESYQEGVKFEILTGYISKLEQGGLDSGLPYNYPTRIRSVDFIEYVDKTNLQGLNNINEVYFVWYDKDKNYISQSSWTTSNTIAPTNTKYYKFVIRYKNDNPITPSQICVAHSHENKTEILSSSSLKYGDYYSTDGVKHINSYEYVVKGTEDISLHTTKTNILIFRIPVPVPMKINSVVICDKFTSKTFGEIYNNDVEGISSHNSEVTKNVYVSILKTKLATQDTAGMKLWMQNNNTTIICQKDSESIENTNKTLISKGYPNGMLQINAGPVQPHAKGTYATNISERAASMENAIDKLQEDVTDLKSSALVLAGEVINAKQGIQKLNTDIDQKINSTIENLNKQIADMKNSIWIA